jgi:serine/threonine protein kinase
MPRRCNDSLSDDDPPKKKNCNNLVPSSFDLKHGEFLKDITGKQWKLGKAVGIGGFGEIYLASDNLTKEVKTDSEYVAKVESHKNGPLFVEMNCYLRIAKPGMIEEWKRDKKINSLGMPHYVASGSHVHKGERYRFLILPKFDKDLEKILQEKRTLNIKTVLTISSQIVDVLEYIHSKGYIHSDIKASNILLSNKKIYEKPQVPSRISNKYTFANPVRACRLLKVPSRRVTRILRTHPNISYVDDIPDFEKILQNAGYAENEECKSNSDQVYLLDYGLACKFLTSDGTHKPYCVDERKAHAGTILFCSRDAHEGVQSRRSDLESLGYNIIYWLTGNLPWANDVDNPEIVKKKKQRAMSNVEYFLNSCFTEHPKFLEDYFKYLHKLQFQEKPNYNYCKKLFKDSIKASGYKDDSCFDFENLERCRQKQIKVKKRVSENIKVCRFIQKVSRPPLQSNIPVKPLLRKKVKNKKCKNNWFEEIVDPEVIIKQAREKRNIETTNIADLNINRLNPTYAMIEVYNKCRERIDIPTSKGDSTLENVNGYTHAMMSVLQKIKKRKELECERLAVNLNSTKTDKTMRRCISKRKKKYESPARSPPQTRTARSAVVIKKEHFQTRKVKSAVLRRTYSLRG